MDSLGRLPSVFARNCDVVRIDRPTARTFLEKNHRLGFASARFHYGLFLRRTTGASESTGLLPGTLVAVSSFSDARRMPDGSRSCEWVRYACLPGIRVVGGMGRLLDEFVGKARPDDVMSYADASWSEGECYRRLGFELVGKVGGEGFENLKFKKKYEYERKASWEDA